jgi:ketosteroid isomerase-like protein
MDTRDAARRWADAWEHAWREHDAEALRAVYAEDCVFRSHPFREPYLGADGVVAYARWAFESELSADARFGEPVVDGDRAVVDYWALCVGTDGAEETIAGCSVLRFGDDGTVLEQRDYWAAGGGHHPPPESRSGQH